MTRFVLTKISLIARALCNFGKLQDIELKSFLAALLLVAIITLPSAATATNGTPLPVPKMTLYPGDTITAELLQDRLFKSNWAARQAVFRNSERLIGKVARLTLLPGRPIPLNGVREAYAVEQGKTTLVIFQVGGLTITSYGIPVQSGSVGDIVSLRNIDSGSMVTGIVQPDGTVLLETK
jgi:flagellar basal body P-ring formation protein FlgA